MILRRKEEQMKKLLSALIITTMLFTLSLPVLANSAPAYDGGTDTAEFFTIDENCPIVVQSKELLFDYGNINEIGENGTVTATYEMYNPTNETQQIKMVIPYITKLDILSNNISDETLNITVDGELIPFEIYTSYQTGFYDGTDNKLAEELELTGILQAVSIAYEPTNFDLQETGYLYTITEDKMGYIIHADDTGQRVVFDNLTDCKDEENNIYYKFSILEEDVVYTIFSLDGPIDVYLENLLTGEVEEQGIEIQQITVEEYIKKHQIVPLEESYSFQMENLFNYIVRDLDEEMNALSPIINWNLRTHNKWVDHIILLACTIELLPNQTQTLVVQLPSYIYSNEYIYMEGTCYQEVYLQDSTQYCSNAEKTNVRIVLPKFAPYIIKSNVSFLEEENGIYTANLEELPRTYLTFTFFVQEEEGEAMKGFNLTNIINGIVIAFFCFIILIIFFIAFVFAEKPIGNLEDQFKKGSDHDDHHTIY